MNKFRNRIVNTLIGLLALCSATVVIAIVRAGESRSAVRIQAADLAQIQGYFELHSNLRQFYAEYGRIVEDADSASKLDFDAYRRRIDELLLAVHSEIERESIELGEFKEAGRPYADDETSERARLLVLAREIQSMIAGSEIAAALFRTGRKLEGVKVLEEVLDESVERKLDALIDEAVTANKAQARAIEEAILARFDFVVNRSSVAFVVIAVFLVTTALAILIPFVRSMSFLQGQADKLALGGDLDPPPDRSCREFAAVHDALTRAATKQARLREELDACEAEFRKRADAMREVDQVRRDFLADVSHELRTPLTVLRGVAEVALRTRSNDPKELKSTIARIVDESRHAGRIVDDLFFIARSRVGALDLRTDIVDLAAVSEAAAMEAESLAARAEGQVTWHGLSEPVEVEGDADRLRQLFTILVDNALKHGGRHPTIEVDHAQVAESVVIDVRDHGPGVSEDDLPHIFERLYRGATTVEPDGSGLGLPLAKSIVEGHGGSISLENAAGGGAIARVSLPIFDANALEATGT